MKLIGTGAVIIISTLFLSCIFDNEDKDTAKIFYKSTFLGTESFTLEGTLYDGSGKQKTGNSIVAKIGNHEEKWTIKETMNNSRFSITINKKDDNGQILPFPDKEEYNYDTAWDIFTSYYQPWVGGSDNPERDKKMYLLCFFLDSYDDRYKNSIFEFSENTPQKYSYESIMYVFIPEPLTIQGTYTFEDEMWKYYESYDCDFSRIGWYKIISKITEPIGKNPVYNSATKTKFCTSRER